MNRELLAGSDAIDNPLRSAHQSVPQGPHLRIGEVGRYYVSDARARVRMVLVVASVGVHESLQLVGIGQGPAVDVDGYSREYGGLSGSSSVLELVV